MEHVQAERLVEERFPHEPDLRQGQRISASDVRIHKRVRECSRSRKASGIEISRAGIKIMKHRTMEEWVESGPKPDRTSLQGGSREGFSSLLPGPDPVRALLDLSGEALILVRLPSGRLVDANQSASRLLGYPREELLARSLPEIFPTAEMGKSCLILSGDGSSPDEKRFQTVLRDARGGEIPVEMYFECLTSGGNAYAAIAARDITERVRAQQALKRESDKAQNYLDVAGVILVVIGADRKISLINQKGCEVLGYKEEEMIGMDWFDRFLPEWSRDSVRSGFDMLMRGETQPAEYFENPVVTKSGDERMIAWHNTVLRDEAGRVIGTLSSGQDITERKKTEIELWRHRERLEELVQQRTLDLLHSEEKYRTLVENVPLGVYRVTPDGQILFLNRFVKEVFGFSPAEIYRNPRLWRERVYEEDRAEVEDLRAKSLASGSEMIVEYRVKHKDGRIVQVAEHAIPFRGADGRVSSVDGIILDITAMKKIQEKLVQAEEIKTLSEVSARLAHEIRNPLASAGGFARRLLSSMERSDPDRETMVIIVNEVARLETILRMILVYLEPLELELSPTDPNKLLEGVLKALEPEIRAKKAKWHLHLSPEIPEVWMDGPKMERVFHTLLKKALSQVREGEAVSIFTFEERHLFRFQMSYPVQEMPSDDVEHFFYPFNASLLEENLDLPRVEILVHKHGGFVEVRLRRPEELVIQMSLPFAPSITEGRASSAEAPQGRAKDNLPG
jgi:PAS domain S-box-containing protein